MALQPTNNKASSATIRTSLDIKKTKPKLTTKSICLSREEFDRVEEIQSNFDIKTFADFMKTVLFNYDELIREVGYEEFRSEMAKGYTMNRALKNLIRKD